MYKTSRRGRPTIPIEFSLKCLILQYIYNLSDPALEDALVDRLSFQRFPGIGFETDIPVSESSGNQKGSSGVK